MNDNATVATPPWQGSGRGWTAVAQVMRAEDAIDGDVEFTTVIWFESLDSVRNFMGENDRRAQLPETARAALRQPESEAKNFNLVGDFS